MDIVGRLRRLPVVGTAMAIQDRYNADLGSHLAASIAFFAFLSIFPVLLLALSVVGFLLAGDPQLQEDIVRTIVLGIPGLSGQFEDAIERLIANRGVTGIVGAVGVLLAGLRVINGATATTSRVFRYEDGPNIVIGKLRAVAALVVLGILFVIGASASAALGVASEAVQAMGYAPAVAQAIRWLAPAIAFAADFAFYATAYRILSAGPGPPWRDLWPGALIAAAGWTLLKAFGATYAANQAERWNALYGAIGGVVALMLLLYVAARIYVYGAVINAYRRERRAEGPAGDDSP